MCYYKHSLSKGVNILLGQPVIPIPFPGSGMSTYCDANALGLVSVVLALIMFLTSAVPSKYVVSANIKT